MDCVLQTVCPLIDILRFLCYARLVNIIMTQLDPLECHLVDTQLLIHNTHICLFKYLKEMRSYPQKYHKLWKTVVIT